jgi:ECF sigma factor
VREEAYLALRQGAEAATEGGVPHVSLEEAAVVGGARRRDERAGAARSAKSAGRRRAFWGGLSVEETAEALKVSSVTVIRDWRTVKAWLYCELTGGAG